MVQLIIILGIPKNHMSKANPTMDRQLITYPHPKYHMLFIAECHANLSCKADWLERIIRKHYDEMSEGNRNGLQIMWNEMTEEQRKKPNLKEK